MEILHQIAGFFAPAIESASLALWSMLVAAAGLYTGYGEAKYKKFAGGLTIFLLAILGTPVVVNFNLPGYVNLQWSKYILAILALLLITGCLGYMGGKVEKTLRLH